MPGRHTLPLAVRAAPDRSLSAPSRPFSGHCRRYLSSSSPSRVRSRESAFAPAAGRPVASRTDTTRTYERSHATWRNPRTGSACVRTWKEQVSRGRELPGGRGMSCPIRGRNAAGYGSDRSVRGSRTTDRGRSSRSGAVVRSPRSVAPRTVHRRAQGHLPSRHTPRHRPDVAPDDTIRQYRSLAPASSGPSHQPGRLDGRPDPRSRVGHLGDEPIPQGAIVAAADPGRPDFSHLMYLYTTRWFTETDI